MDRNTLLTNPLKLVIYDPVNNKNRHTKIFLGDVPIGIRRACENYARASKAQISAYDKLLRSYYGASYKHKLGLDVKHVDRAFLTSPVEPNFIFGKHEDASLAPYNIDLVRSIAKNVSSVELSPYTLKNVHNQHSTSVIVYDGVVIDGSNLVRDAIANRDKTIAVKIITDDQLSKCVVKGGLDIENIDMSDVEELLREPVQTQEKKTTYERSDLTVRFEPGIDYNSDVFIYPEDTFADLKAKVYLATNIPPYRQHIFYIDNNRLKTTYRLSVGGIYEVDITKMNMAEEHIHSVPYNKDIYEMRDIIHVEALDSFKIIDDNVDDNIVYVVDLDQFTSNVHSLLRESLTDTYKFELFYFGCIIKYWPQLTKECFYDYIYNEAELHYKYPDLAPAKSLLKTIYRAESDVINYKYRNAVKAAQLALKYDVNIAITKATANNIASVTSMMLNIRTLFDKLQATRCIPEIHAYIEHDSRRYMLRKRYIRNGIDIQFPSGSLMKTGITLAISLQRSDQLSAHARNTISTVDNEQSRYMFLNIWPNGKYYIHSIWNEEDQLGFKDVNRIMKKFVDPILIDINKLKRYVFITGNGLPLVGDSVIEYGDVNVCIYWKKVMLENTFKIIKSLWEPYMRANITSTRNVQQFDKYEILFRKGIYEFNPTVIDRVISASNNIVLNNHYAYLSNNTIKQKWEQSYGGRIVRMSHRTTDVRFEILNVGSKELTTFNSYVVSFIYRALHNDRVVDSMKNVRDYKNEKTLRKLREQDPELFNLKKYDSRFVYSTLCQRPKQPLIYTQDEIRNMSAAQKKKLTQYWNFTLQRPAFYACPNAKYPHLSFKVGYHPKNYCLPCCYKKHHIESASKKASLNKICLEKHEYVEEDSAASFSKHIIKYGKSVDTGRLSKLPQTLNSLLFGTSDKKYKYYIYGVPQHVPGVTNVGAVFSIASALDITIVDLVKEIIKTLKRETSSRLFSTLLNGTLCEYFTNMEDLIITLRTLFINMKSNISELQRFEQWPELFMEIVHIMFDVSIFTFIDKEGDGSDVSLYVPNLMRNEISYVNKLSSDKNNLIANIMLAQKYIVLIKRVNQYYPIYLISNTYFKTQEVEMKYFAYEDTVCKLLYDMVIHNESKEALSVQKIHDLAIVKEFVYRTKYVIKTQYINRHNICYAVLLDSPDGLIYLPLKYSVYVADGTKITFDPFIRTKLDLPYNALQKFITVFNRFITTNYTVGSNSSLYSYDLIKPITYILFNEKIIGFKQNELIYYFNQLEPTKQDATIKIKYDYNQINKLILERAPPVKDPRSMKIGEAVYDNYLYQLFIIEFINYIDRERNTKLRKAIKDLITTTNFKKAIGGFHTALSALLKDHPTDYKTITNQLFGFYYTHFNKPLLMRQIDDTIYNFDHITLNTLRGLDKAALMVEIKKITSKIMVEKDLDTTNIKFPNIYVPCEELDAVPGYCEGKKLIVNKDIDKLIELLARDLMDDLKSKYLLDNIWLDIIISFFNFKRNPTEIITIYKLTE